MQKAIVTSSKNGRKEPSQQGIRGSRIQGRMAERKEKKLEDKLGNREQNVDKRKKASEKVGRLQRAQQIHQPSRHRRVRASTVAKKSEKDKENDGKKRSNQESGQHRYEN